MPRQMHICQGFLGFYADFKSIIKNNAPMATPKGKFPPEIKAKAEILYVLERKEEGEVCTILSISPATFRRWKAQGKWSEKRGMEVLESPYMVKRLHAQISAVLKKAEDDGRTLTASEMDGIYKVRKLIEALDKNAIFASHAIRTIDMFNAYLAIHAPNLRDGLTVHLLEFINQLTQDYTR